MMMRNDHANQELLHKMVLAHDINTGDRFQFSITVRMLLVTHQGREERRRLEKESFIMLSEFYGTA